MSNSPRKRFHRFLVNKILSASQFCYILCAPIIYGSHDRDVFRAFRSSMQDKTIKRVVFRQIAYPAKRKRVLDCMDALKARKIDQRTVPLIDSLIKFHIHKVPLLVSAYIFDDTLRGLYSVSKREIARHG